ncbi:hypothetical protein ABW20_dc0102763 [Dactylellina cionopaga]|nr:hypothetical protein ABW20_dc0102763 [Dactylellina cionopaga]
MLRKVTLQARRSYNWICSDCRTRLGYYSVRQSHNARSFNRSTSFSPSRGFFRCLSTSSGSSPGRNQNSDTTPQGDGLSQKVQDEGLESDNGSNFNDKMNDVTNQSQSNDPPQGSARRQRAVWKNRSRRPISRDEMVKDLERINASLAKRGYKLINPKTKATQSHIVTRREKKSRGHKLSIWQKFKREYIKRYRDGDPLILMGRPRNWKPTVSELHQEYVKYFWEHKQKLTKLFALRRHWHDAPDLQRKFHNILFMLERFTNPKTLEAYSFKEPTSTVLTKTGEPLDNLVASWQKPLQRFDPDTYSPVNSTLEERNEDMTILKYWRPPGTMPDDINEFRLQYMGEVDADALAAAFDIKLERLPLSSRELLSLIKALTSLKISKQDLRYVLPRGYIDSVEFITCSIVSLIISHERDIALNTAIMNTAINYMMKVNHTKKGRHLLDYMEYLQIPMNLGTFREALRAAAKAKDIFVFERLVTRIMRMKIKFNHEVWRAFLSCVHTPGQQLQVFESITKLGMDPKSLVPGHLIRLSFQMYKDQLRMGNTKVEIPWRHLAGIKLDANTANPIFEFLYENRAYDEARSFFYRASKELGLSPNYDTLRILVRHNCRIRLPMVAISAIRVFAEVYNIEARADVLEILFQLAHRFRYYNVVRTIWAHACLSNQVSKKMMDRMRHDIYETGRSAGKPGKLALGVCSEDTETVVKTPVWAMRLVSKSKDPRAYLMTEGGLYENPATMSDLSDMEERQKTLDEFKAKAVELRKELMRMDLVAHQKWKPRRSFVADLIAAVRRDRFLRAKHPQCASWSPLTWAWSIFQVRRVPRDADVEKILEWERKQENFKRMQALKERKWLNEDRIYAKSYALLEKMPRALNGRWPNTPNNPDWLPPKDDSGNDNPPATPEDVTEEEEEELAGKDLYAFYEHILNDDLESPEFGDYDLDDDDTHSLLDDEFLEREAGLALDETVESWDESPIPDRGEEEIQTNLRDEETKKIVEGGDTEHIEMMKRRAAAKALDSK